MHTLRMSFFSRLPLLGAALLAATGAVVSAGAAAPVFRVVQTTISFEAGAARFETWPGAGASTWHSGIGYIEPFGQASYSCGTDYPEAQRYPLPAYLGELIKAQTADSNPLFCVYTLKGGALYVYDAVVGNMFRDPLTDERREELINVIVGGSGEFAGATGFWVGVTQGRGALSKVASGRELPVSILKLMNGYLRLPRA